MDKKFIVARYWRGSYVQTICKPTTKEEAENLSERLNKEAGVFDKYEVKEINPKKN